jgi:hypothetical protein
VLVLTLVLLAVLAAPASSGSAPPAQGDVVAPLTLADRVAAARRRAELGALEALLEAERGRPSGARVRDVVDGKGHRLVLFVARTSGPVERVHSFEPGFAVATLYALILDAERKVRLLLVEPKGRQDGYEIDQILFGRDGKVAARDHIYGTFTDCADGRFHDHRIVTVFGPALRVLERSVEFFNDPPGSGSRFTEGCTLEVAKPPFPDAPSFLLAHHLERAAREAGVRVGRSAEVGGPQTR